MKKNKASNRLDVLIEKLATEFAKIPNFELTQTDDLAKRVWQTIMFRLSDLSSFKELVSNHFIPATNKAIFQAKQEIATSRYKHLIKIDNSLLNETYYDTIRNAYVSLFHKFESYIGDVIKIASIMFEDPENKLKEQIDKYAKRKFGFDIKNWHQFYITQKINWICNCVKHYDGYPIKKPVPIFFQNIPEDKRIELTVDDFKRDCDMLTQFSPLYLQIMFVISSYYNVFENFIRKDWEDMPDYLITHDQSEKEASEKVTLLLKTLESMS